MRFHEIVSESVTESPAFKAWFGNSKVVDKTGHPQVVYHGTANSFTAFDPDRTGDIGIHFGNAAQASQATKNIFGQHHDNANIIPVYLKIEKPVRVKDMFSTMNSRWIARVNHYRLHCGINFAGDMHERIYDLAKQLDKIRSKSGGSYSIALSGKTPTTEQYANLEKQFWKTVEQAARQSGFDGMIYQNKAEGKGLSYLIFDPHQAKSVFNIGTWDGAKSDIGETSASGF